MMKDRREFFVKSFKGLCLYAGGGFLAALASKADESIFLRPPGAEDKERFLSKCIRYGLCVKACPYDTLKLASLFDAPQNGTPFFKSREIPCYFYENIPCVKDCPTDTLDKNYLEEENGIKEFKMGIAIVDSASCVAHWGIQCDACYRVCPLIDRALKIETKRNERIVKHAFLLSVVDHEYCVGCGLYEKTYTIEEAAIRVLPRVYVLGKAGAHYVKDWDKQDEDKLKSSSAQRKLDNERAKDYLNAEDLL